jgi:hypothetical protein
MELELRNETGKEGRRENLVGHHQKAVDIFTMDSNCETQNTTAASQQ